MGYQRKMSVLRSDSTGGTVPGSFNRSLLRLRTFREYLDDGWALIVIMIAILKCPAALQ